MNKANYFLKLGEVEYCLDELKRLAAGDGSPSNFAAMKVYQISHAFEKLLEARTFFYGEKWQKEIKNCMMLANVVVKSPINLDKLIPLTAELYKDMDQFISDTTIDEVLDA